MDKITSPLTFRPPATLKPGVRIRYKPNKDYEAVYPAVERTWNLGTVDFLDRKSRSLVIKTVLNPSNPGGYYTRWLAYEQFDVEVIMNE